MSVVDIEAPRFFTRTGDAVLSLLSHVGGCVQLAFRTLREMLTLRLDGEETLRQLDRFGPHIAPLLAGGSIVIGGVIALQGLQYIDRYAAGEVFGWAAALSSFREVGPLFLGLTLASRAGARNTAELATLNAKDRLEALAALGLDPFRVVVLPRIVAISIGTALLFPISATAMLASAMGFATLLGGPTVTTSFWSFLSYLPSSAVLEGLFRMSVFGVAIAIASTHFGLRAGGDARAVGRAVYASSVACASAVVIVNLVLSLGTSA